MAGWWRRSIITWSVCYWSPKQSPVCWDMVSLDLMMFQWESDFRLCSGNMTPKTTVSLGNVCVCTPDVLGHRYLSPAERELYLQLQELMSTALAVYVLKWKLHTWQELTAKYLTAQFSLPKPCLGDKMLPEMQLKMLKLSTQRTRTLFIHLFSCKMCLGWL